MAGDNMATHLEGGPRPVNPKDKKPLSPVTKLAMAGSALVLGAAGVGAKLGLFNGNGSSTVDNVPVATAPAKVEATPKAEVTVAPPVTTPEVKQEETIILTSDLRNKAELVQRKLPNGQVFNIVTVDTPDHTPVYAPMDGELSKAKSDTGFLGQISVPGDATTESLGIQGKIRFNNALTEKVSKGQLIGYTDSTIEQKQSPLGNHTLYISETHAENGAIVDYPNKLREWFPKAFQAGPKSIVENNSSSTTQTTYTTPHYN